LSSVPIEGNTADATCEQRRMHDLAGDMYLGQSALSRTVARLERAVLAEHLTTA
jgi:DNA-binding MarR family transcriptional regulator